jgi:hypothetical protein
VEPRGDYFPHRRVWWMVGKGEPEVELIVLSEKIGYRDHGGMLLEFWNDEGMGVRGQRMELRTSRYPVRRETSRALSQSP